MTSLLTLLFALLVVACTSSPDPQQPMGQTLTPEKAVHDSGEGQRYITALFEAVQESDRIVISEHSNVYDILDPVRQPQRPAQYRPIVYATHELTAGERGRFLASIKNMAPATQDAETACIFDPHHTLAFYREKKQTSAMLICFQCGQVEWDGTGHQRPWSLIPTLQALIVELGMKPKRDWRALADTGSSRNAPEGGQAVR